MMNQFRQVSIFMVVILALVGLVLAGCSTRYTPKNAPKVFDCAACGNVEKTIAPEAGLEEFSCSFKKWEGADTLHFKVAIRNVSAKPQRYRVNIFLDDGKAVGGLIPRKTKKGLVKPGQTSSFVYPVKGVPRQPKNVTLIIKTIEP